jgi:hypothetical protein
VKCNHQLKNDKLFNLSTIETLEHLEVRYSGELTDDIWDHIANMPKFCIWHFDLHYCEITDADLEQIATNLKCQVQSLDLSNVTDTGLGHIGKILELRDLRFQNCDNITVASFECLVTLPKLQHLHLFNCGITDAHLVYISKMSELRDLNLAHNSDITRTGLDYLATGRLSKLQTLNLYECFDITDAGLTSICRLSELQTLNVSSFSCDITNVGLEYLSKKLLKLQELDLQSCGKLTDAGLHYLTKLPALRYLDVSVNDGITRECIEHLKAKFPRLCLEHTVG